MSNTNTQRPAVTVLMPVHNGGRFLTEAIDSILGQTFKDFEFVVVDDASTDDTAKVLAGVDDPRMVVLANDSQSGVAASLNRGIDAARGDLIARMDADDVADPRRLEHQVAFMADHPDVVLCGTEAQRIDADGLHLQSIKRLHSDIEIRWHLLTANPFIHPSVVFRTETIRRIGGYDPALQCAQDYDLWCRLSMEGKCANLPEQLVQYRFHSQAISANKRNQQLQVTRQRSRRYLLESGTVDSETEAAMFLAFSGHTGEESSIGDYSPGQWQRYPQMVNRFFDRFEASQAGVPEAIGRCRQRIRRKLLGKVSRQGTSIAGTMRLMQIARQVDPSGMRWTSIASRTAARVCRRLHLATGQTEGNRLTASSSIQSEGKKEATA